MSNFLHIYLEKIPIEEVEYLNYELIERISPYRGSYYLWIPANELNNLKSALLLDNIHLTQPRNKNSYWYDMERI